MSNKDKINKQIEVQRKYKSQLDNVVNKVPYLKKIKDNAEGLTHRGDIISEKPKFRTKVNGRYVDEDNTDD